MAHAKLQRVLGLPLLVLYGTGITVGAGIYVLIGEVAGHAGKYAPWSFILASAVMAFTVASYIELATRYPVSAGETAYVSAAFRSKALSTFVGLLTIAVGMVSSAAVALGAAGYIQQFVPVGQSGIAVAVVVVLGAIAARGILESVLLASLFTLIEVGGLIAIVLAAIYADTPITSSLWSIPSFELSAYSGIAFGSLIAFFAFIGFEDLANIIEETKEPQRNIPLAMIIVLFITTALYVVIAAVSIGAVSAERLAASPAPLSLVFREVARMSPATITAIAIVATLNTILAQMTLASRVIYGMACQGTLPGILSTLGSRTATPWLATGLVTASVSLLVLTVPLSWLAESTSIATLIIFSLVNVALLRIRYRGDLSPEHHIRVPIWMPIIGLISSLAMIGSGLLR